jgi:transcriptional regulator of acetoin/glycerol metabolism
VKIHLDNGGAYHEAEARTSRLALAIARLEAAVTENADLETLLPKLATMKREHKECVRVMQETAVPLQSQFLHSQRLIEALATAQGPDRENLRRELRQTIALTIRRVDVTVKGGPKQGKDVEALVTFKDGKQRSIWYTTRAGRVTACGLVLTGDGRHNFDALQTFAEVSKDTPFPVDPDPVDEVRAKCRELRAAGVMIQHIAARLNIHRTTVWRHLQRD